MVVNRLLPHAGPIGNAVDVDQVFYQGSRLVLRQRKSRHTHAQPRSPRRARSPNRLLKRLGVQLVSHAQKRRRLQPG
jgi:hypothetical protein